jgi:hypothetical protein
MELGRPSEKVLVVGDGRVMCPPVKAFPDHKDPD